MTQPELKLNPADLGVAYGENAENTIKAWREGKNRSAFPEVGLMFLEKKYAEARGEETFYMKTGCATWPEIRAMQIALASKGLPVPKTALEVGLEQRGIRAFGTYTSEFRTLYADSQSIQWVPFLFESFIHRTMMLDPVIQDIIRGEVNIEQRVKIALRFLNTEYQRKLVKLYEGDPLPRMSFGADNKFNRLFKIGGYIPATFDLLKFQSIDSVRMFIEDVFTQHRIDRTSWCVNAMLCGDDTTAGYAPPILLGGNCLTVAQVLQFVRFLGGMASPGRQVTTILARKNVAILWQLAMARIGQYQQGLNAPSIAGIPMPRLIEWDHPEAWLCRDQNGNITANWSDALLGFDRNRAVVALTSGALNVEAERLIEQQIEGTGIWGWFGTELFDPLSTVTMLTDWDESIYGPKAVPCSPNVDPFLCCQT